MNADGTVRAEQKISAAAGPLAPHSTTRTGSATPSPASATSTATAPPTSPSAPAKTTTAAPTQAPSTSSASPPTAPSSNRQDQRHHRWPHRPARRLRPLRAASPPSATSTATAPSNLAISARYDDDGGPNRGAIYILDLGCLDTDGDGLCDIRRCCTATPTATASPTGSTPTTTATAIATALESADPNGDGDPRDALDSDRDGQPDYLDAPTDPTGGIVADEQKISDTVGGLTATLDNVDWFG
jgi:hypothetical protein